MHFSANKNAHTQNPFLGIRLWHLEWALLNYTSEILKVSTHTHTRIQRQIQKAKTNRASNLPTLLSATSLCRMHCMLLAGCKLEPTKNSASALSARMLFLSAKSGDVSVCVRERE